MAIEISQNSIALLHRNQIDSLTVSELKLAAKEYNLRGYSKLKKAELANLIYETSDILRQSMLRSHEQATQLEKDENEQIRQNLIERDGGLHPFSREGIEQRVDKLRSTAKGKKMSDHEIGEAVAASLYDFTKLGNYANKTIAKDFTQRIRDAIKLNEKLSPQIYESLKHKWDGFVRLNNIEIVRESEIQKRDLAVNAEKIFTQEKTNQIIEWAVSNLSNKSVYFSGISFSILTGRRMVEIYGNQAQYSLNDKNEHLINIVGVAKKKESKEDTVYQFIPLNKPKTLVEFINNFPKRGYEPIQVKRTIASKISRKFPPYLKDLGIEKFKDCRDFYAGVTYKNFSEAGIRRPMKPTQYCMAHDNLDTTATYDKYDTGVWGDLEVYIDYAKNHTV